MASLNAAEASEPAGKGWTGDFAVTTLSFDGILRGHKAVDLDGNGTKEILATVDGVEKQLQIFSLGPDGTYLSRPAAAIPIPLNTFFLLTTDWNRDKLLDIGFCGAEKTLVIFQSTGGRWSGKPVLVCEHPLEFPGFPEASTWLDFPENLTGNGQPGLLLPDRTGWSLYSGPTAPESGPVPASQHLSTAHLTTLRKRDSSLSFTMPLPVFHDFNGDSRKDPVALLKGKVAVFLSNAEGGFSTVPVEGNYKELLGVEDEDSLEIQTLEDFNGDGRTDVVVVRRENTEKMLKGGATSTLFFFPTGPDGRPGKKPSQKVSIEATFTHLELLDVNGDGRKDVVYPVFKVGFGLFWAFITGKLTVPIQALIQQPDGSFLQDDRFESSFKADVHNPVGAAKGDFDGDGFEDVLVPADESHWNLYCRDPKGLFESKPRGKVDLALLKGARPSREPEALDLDGDGRDDLVWDFSNGGPSGKLTTWVQR